MFVVNFHYFCFHFQHYCLQLFASLFCIFIAVFCFNYYADEPECFHCKVKHQSIVSLNWHLWSHMLHLQLILQQVKTHVKIQIQEDVVSYVLKILNCWNRIWIYVYTRWVIIMGTPTKSGISLLLGHIFGYNVAWLSPIILSEMVLKLSTLNTLTYILTYLLISWRHTSVVR